jgi:hypothetical protein
MVGGFNAVLAWTNPSATPPSESLTPIPVTDGGTGAASAASARADLGAAASGANSDITSLTPSNGSPLLVGNNGIILSTGSEFDTDQGGSIELGGNNSTANPISGGVPYIDFHYGTGSAQDFNVRLQNNANDAFQIMGSGGALTLNVGTDGSSDTLIVGNGSGQLQVGNIKFPDGTVQTTANVPSILLFSTPGSYSEWIPTNATNVTIEGWGGGGGGAGGTASPGYSWTSPAGGGGGSGGFFKKSFSNLNLTTPTQITCTVGAGGGGGCEAENGVCSGNSGGLTTCNFLGATTTAAGGGGAAGGYTSYGNYPGPGYGSTGGAGGTASGGDVNTTGNSGQSTPDLTGPQTGGNGGSASVPDTQDGYSGSAGIGGTGNAGPGDTGVNYYGSPGTAGFVPGAGGGGGGSAVSTNGTFVGGNVFGGAGGYGANGLVRISWW